jgi:hypothetical protein
MSIIVHKGLATQWVSDWYALGELRPSFVEYIANRAAQWALEQAMTTCEAVHSQLSDEYDINGTAAASWCAASIRAMITPEGNADIGKESA